MSTAFKPITGDGVRYEFVGVAWRIYIGPDHVMWAIRMYQDVMDQGQFVIEADFEGAVFVPRTWLIS